VALIDVLLGLSVLVSMFGVVNTLSCLVHHLEGRGIEVLVIAPDGHRTFHEELDGL